MHLSGQGFIAYNSSKNPAKMCKLSKQISWPEFHCTDTGWWKIAVV